MLDLYIIAAHLPPLPQWLGPSSPSAFFHHHSQDVPLWKRLAALSTELGFYR